MLGIIPNKQLCNTSHLYIVYIDIVIIMYLFVFTGVLVGWGEIWVIITILVM